MATAEFCQTFRLSGGGAEKLYNVLAHVFGFRGECFRLSNEQIDLGVEGISHPWQQGIR